MSLRRIAVLGGGNGAHAHAADLALAGHDVRLFELPAFQRNIAGAQIAGGVDLIPEVRGVPGTSAAAGGRLGFAELETVTTDIDEAVRGAELIFVVVPAFGQRAFMEDLIPVLEDGQIVIFCPGMFASLEFKNLLVKAEVQADIIIGETESLLYSARLQAPGQVWIKTFKKQLGFATLPTRRVQEALSVISECYPQFVPSGSVFETSFYKPALVMHPVSALLNVPKIDEMGPYRYRFYDITPAMARVMEALDKERMDIAEKLGLPVISLAQKLHQFYGSDPGSIYQAITTTPSYAHQTSPDSFTHRYVTEDVPYGLVPLTELGRVANVSTRACNMIIDLACFINNTDYWSEGRTLARMGLEGMGLEDIRCLMEE